MAILHLQPGHKWGLELVKALGLENHMVRDIRIDVPIDGNVVATVELVMDTEQSVEVLRFLAAGDWKSPEQVSETKRTLCPHDMPPEECDACMQASDHAYDAAREDRFFGRGR